MGAIPRMMCAQSGPGSVPATPAAAPTRLPVSMIVKELNLSPGERVLLLGVADGSLAGAIAAEVGPGGSVLAADTRQAAVKSLQDKAAAGQLAQLKSIELGADWASQITGGFDTLVLHDWMDRLPRRAENLRLLHRSLRQPGGRLFVLRREFLPDFDEGAPFDPKAVLQKARRFGGQSPFYLRLPANLQAEAAEGADAETTVSKAEMVSFLNQCLRDQRLPAEIMRFDLATSCQPGDKHLNPNFDSLASVLFGALFHTYHRAFEPGARFETAQQELAIRTANHLILTSVFKLPREAALYVDDALCSPDRAVVEMLQAAGFESRRQQRVAPHFAILEFQHRKSVPAAATPPKAGQNSSAPTATPEPEARESIREAPRSGAGATPKPAPPQGAAPDISEDRELVDLLLFGQVFPRNASGQPARPRPPPVAGGRYRKRPPEPGFIRRERLGHLPTDQVIEVLRLTEGMTVVDVGAGPGYYTFAMARAVGETGKVYATDVDQGAVQSLQAEGRASGLSNLEAQLVRPGTFDDFYRGKSFDRVFLSSVVNYLADPEAYFREMRPSLKEKTGTAVIVHPLVVWRYQPEPLLYNHATIAANLTRAAASPHPLIKFLDRSAQAAFGGTAPAATPDADQWEAFMQGLNRAAEAPAFTREIIEYDAGNLPSGFFDPASRLGDQALVFKWFYHAHNDLFDPAGEPKTAEQLTAVRMINKAFIIPLILGPPNFGGWAFPRAFFLPPQGIVDYMQRAGYKLVRSVDQFTYFCFLEFAPALNAEGGIQGER